MELPVDTYRTHTQPMLSHINVGTGVDLTISELAQAVAEAQLGSARQTLALHQAEALRLQLVGDDGALTRFMADHPGADAQQLRSLIRAARKEAALPPEQRHGRAWRDLFQFIKPFVVV
jgi:ribosome-associated protein